MPFTTINQIKMYYEQCGTGPDLVLISGLSADHSTWQSIVGILSKKFRLLLFDNRGVGQTDAPPGPYSTSQMANDVAALMQALSIKQAYIVGLSLGGHIAQYLAIEHPQLVKKLILCCSKPYTSKLTRLRQENWLKLIQAGIDKKLLLENSLIWLVAEPFLNDNEKCKQLIELTLKNPYPQTEIGYLGQVAATLNHDTRGLLSQIKAPTLIISGTEDIFTSPANSEYLATHIPHAQLHLLKETGHLIHVEKPKEFANLIINFCKT